MNAYNFPLIYLLSWTALGNLELCLAWRLWGKFLGARGEISLADMKMMSLGETSRDSVGGERGPLAGAGELIQSISYIDWVIGASGK